MPSPNTLDASGGLLHTCKGTFYRSPDWPRAAVQIWRFHSFIFKDLPLRGAVVWLEGFKLNGPMALEDVAVIQVAILGHLQGDAFESQSEGMPCAVQSRSQLR